MLQQREFHATPSAQLRELLGKLEAHIGRLERDSREEVQKIPTLFDAAHALIVELERAGASFPAETTRFETASATFRRKAKPFLRTIGGAENLAALRFERSLAPEQWWWFIDQWWAEQRKAQRRHQVKSLLIGATVLAVVVVVYVLLLAPDKTVSQTIRLQRTAEQLAQVGDYTAALNTVNEALALSPGDASLLALKGVVQTQLGFEAEAATTFADAEVAAGNREQFLLTRAQIYLMLGQPEAVLVDAGAVIAANPQSARGYLYLAQANTDLGNFLEADMHYDEAGRLADAAGDPEIAAIARVQKAYLYQQLFLPTPTAP
jgi:tetratricopeptide (TPR) repeat protein